MVSGESEVLTMDTRKMTRCALFAALLAVCGWLSVPVGDGAVSLQTFGVLLCLGVLGGKWGTVTCLCYVLLGAVGVPVFTGVQGGIGVLLGPTGGYIWGFLACSLIYWVLEKRLPMWLCMILGLAACYTCGTVWYALMYAQGGIWAVAVKCVLPYLLPDGVKLGLALVLSKRIGYIKSPPVA